MAKARKRQGLPEAKDASADNNDRERSHELCVFRCELRASHDAMAASIPKHDALAPLVRPALQLSITVYDDMHARIHQLWRDAMPKRL